MHQTPGSHGQVSSEGRGHSCCSKRDSYHPAAKRAACRSMSYSAGMNVGFDFSSSFSVGFFFFRFFSDSAIPSCRNADGQMKGLLLGILQLSFTDPTRV